MSLIEIQDFLLKIPGIIWDVRFLWIPAVLAIIFWDLWLYYIRSKFIIGMEWVLLEIKLPREILKSPKAMEVALNGLHLSKSPNFIEKYWKGILPPWLSLEIVGINGNVHFFIRSTKFFRNLVEAQIYAQYPDVEIVEVNDYAQLSVTEGFNDEWSSFGTEFKLSTDDAYPIKTYIDYGLHETATKEEQKTDPLTSFLELLGFLKEGEQIWLQIMVRATKKKWKDEGKNLIDKIIGLKPGATTEDRAKAVGALHAGQSETIKAVDRSVSKLGFDAGMRMIYVARQDKFNAINIPSMIGVMKQYSAVNLNGFKPSNTTSVDYFFKKTREAAMKKAMLDAYRKRSFFYMPYIRVPFVLNSEELATIFHFPGRVAETPTFGRIEAKKSEPPSGLPI